MEGDGEGFFCVGCGYDLRGMVVTAEGGGRCPECGRGVVMGESLRSRVAWVHRGEIGRVRAWWRTMGMVMRRPGEVGAEVARPVAWGDASLFRWVMAGLTALVVGVGLGGLYWWMDVRKTFNFGINIWTYAAGGGTSTLLYPLGALLDGPGLIVVAVAGTIVGAGVASWWVRMWFWVLGGRTKERASAVGLYGSAWMLPLGLLAIVDAGFGAWASHEPAMWEDAFALRVILGVIHGAVLGFALVGLVVMLKRATRCGGLGVATSGFAFMVGGPALFAGSVVVVDYFLGTLALMWWSLWG